MTQIINKSKEWSRWNEYWYLIIYLSLTKLTEIHRVDENKKKKQKIIYFWSWVWKSLETFWNENNNFL